ncbi:MAG: carboxypeptidase regulatory-like domain-containing protein, partial [Longimicrobiales bacterium]
MKSLLAIPLVALLAASGAQTRTITVTGRVTDAVQGTPLAGVQVAVVGSHHGDLTDPDGRYALSVPAPLRGATVELVAQTIGY